jgi:triosephosphate isomerase
MAKGKLIAANWKMNGTRAMARTLVKDIRAFAADKALKAEIVLCPPFSLLGMVGCFVKGRELALGAQDCSERAEGAFTGDISAVQVKDLGCTYVILGHSERRAYHNESDSLVAAKMQAAHKAGLKVILCVGEKDAQMEEDMRRIAVRIQLLNSLAASANAENTVIAYEPVWAIGSGVTPTDTNITAMHQWIADCLPGSMKEARILYGGSVTADNAASLLKLKGVDGALVGGASLKKESFFKIVEAV